MTHPEDERLAVLTRLLRRRQRVSQRRLAAVAGVPREDVMRIESGRAGLVKVERVRALVDHLGGRARLSIYYNGAAADRLIDERHAALVERAVGVLLRRGWDVAPEVTYSEYGERGSIDVLAGHATARVIAVCEVKSAIGSLEETNRVLDAKERIAPKLAKARFGYVPATVARLLIVPDEMALRRTVDRHAQTMSVIYPARGREIRRWLREPVGPLRGIWFLSEVGPTDRSPR